MENLRNHFSRLKVNQQLLQAQLDNSRDLVLDLLAEQRNTRWPSQIQRQATENMEPIPR